MVFARHASRHAVSQPAVPPPTITTLRVGLFTASLPLGTQVRASPRGLQFAIVAIGVRRLAAVAIGGRCRFLVEET
jgi:hypothetical protein